MPKYRGDKILIYLGMPSSNPVDKYENKSTKE